MMIEGIEAYYQRIANSIVNAISEDWTMAIMEATFFEDSIFFHGEYTRAIDNVPRSFATTRDGELAFRELRDKFRLAGQPLWGSATFELQSNGHFNMKWNYDDCDELGCARWNADEWLKKQEQNQYRLTRPALKDS